MRLLLVLAIWAALLHFPDPAAAGDLDASYLQALGRALIGHERSGVDIVFTYGPLGWFQAAPYEHGLYWVKVLAWEGALKLVLAVLLARALLCGARGFALALALFALVWPSMGYDGQVYLALLASCAYALEGFALDDAQHPSTLRTGARLMPIAVLALAKFTYFAAGAVCVFAIAQAAWRARSLGSAFVVLALYTALLVVLWIAIGQSLDTLPIFVSRSLALASAFGSAQSLPAAPFELALAFTVLALVVGSIVLALWRSRRDPGQAALAVAALALTLLAFQAGYVRPTGNQITFYGFAAVAVFIAARRGSNSLRVSAALVALAGFALVVGGPLRAVSDGAVRLAANVRAAATPFAFRELRERELGERRAEFDLPRIANAVGSSTAEVFGNEQGILFLNELAWRPRPVFQAYSVFTSAFSRANAEFLASERAPRFVLFRFSTLDGRLPNLSDSATLRALLELYEPRLEENGFLLFERRESGRALTLAPRELVLEQDLDLEAWLELPSNSVPLELALDLDPGFVGRLRTLALGAEPVELEAESRTGQRTRYRIVPAMVDDGVLVAPFLDGTDAWISWISGEEVPGLARVRVLAHGLVGRAHVRLWRSSAILRARAPWLAASLRTSMFASTPATIEAEHGTRRELLRRRLEVLVVGAPARLGFELAPGAWRLRANLGILGEGWLAGEAPVLFAVRVRSPAGATRVLWERTLDATGVPNDRRMIELDLAFAIETGESLDLVTEGASTAAWWTGVRFER